MKTKNLLIVFGVVFLFSCTDRFITDPQAGASGLNGVIFPEPVPFAPDPIEVTGLSATSEIYIHQINVTWNTVSAGVYYWRLFWFSDFASAETALNKAKTTSFYKTEELPAGTQVSRRLSYVRNSYEHLTVYDGEGNEQLLSSGMTFYYLLKGYDGGGRIVAYSGIAVGKTAEVPYNVTATRNYQPNNMQDPARITLTWKWDHSDSSFRLERAQAPFSQDQKWEDRGIVNPSKEGDLYVYTEEFSHGASCVTSSAESFYCDCQIGEEFAYRIYAITDGKSSQPSQIVRGLTVKWGTPSAVEGVSATQGTFGRKISLTWNDVSGTENFKGYSVYVKEKANGNWEKKLDRYTESNRYDYETKSFNTIQFYVTASNHLGEGAPSETVTGYILPQVRNTSATLLEYGSQIIVSWNPISVADRDAGIVYDLYRNETGGEEGSLIAADISADLSGSIKYTDSDPSLVPGKVYYYAIMPKNTTVGSPDGDGQKTAFKDTYGVAGTMPKPEYTVSTGADRVTITVSNKPSYCYSTVTAKRWVYTPVYTKKASASSGIPNQPQTWEQTLSFKNRWTRSKKEFTAVANTTETVIVDPGSAFGWNDYTVYYGFDIPEISFSTHSEAGDEKSGWRQISNEEFLINALRVIDFSQSYLERIHQPGTGAAGFDSVSINGYSGWSAENCAGKGGKCSDKISNPNKGCFHYNAKLGAGSVTVPLIYNEFEAFDMIFSSVGTGHQTEVNLSANGKLVGYINIGGMYSGKLTFDLTITDSVKSGGSYKVQQTGKSEQSLAWDIDRKYF